MGILQTNQPTQTHKVHIHSNQINWQNTNSQTLDKSGQRQQVVLHLVQGVKWEPIGARMKQHPPNAQCRMNGMWTGNTFLLYSPLSPS
jgi:hypothetical protein